MVDVVNFDLQAKKESACVLKGGKIVPYWEDIDESPINFQPVISFGRNQYLFLEYYKTAEDFYRDSVGLEFYKNKYKKVLEGQDELFRIFFHFISLGAKENEMIDCVLEDLNYVVGNREYYKIQLNVLEVPINYEKLFDYFNVYRKLEKDLFEGKMWRKR